jgi:dipeptidyl aminopeptidase/acylaminoacyl peptidase
MELRCAFFAAAGLIVLSAANGQSKPATDPLTQEGYILPPVEVSDAALAPWYKNVAVSNLSPDHRYYVVLERDGMPSLEAMGKDHVNLGGFQVDTAANRARELTTRSSAGIRIVELETKKSVSVPLRPDARVTDAVWSPDSQQIAFLTHFLDRTEIWVANASDGKCRQVTPWPVLATRVTTLRWTKSNALVTVLIPKGRAAVVEKPAIATTPKVKVSDGKVTSIRTYPSLLQNPYEAQLLEFYTTGQLALVDVAKGTVKPVGKPAMIRSVNPSPDGKYFIVSVVEKPFSYIFPVSNFPQREAIWDDSGAEKAFLQRRGLQTGEGGGPTARGAGAADARRFVEWRPDGAGISYVQAEPAAVTPDASGSEDEQAARGGRGQRAGRGGSAGQAPQRPDQVFQWLPPFGAKDAHLLYTSPSRINTLRYSPDMKALFLNQTVLGKDRLSVVGLAPDAKVVTLLETGTDDDAVDLATKPGPVTGIVVRESSDGKFAYLTGTRIAKDPEKEAPRPFIDKIDLATGKRENVFLSKADWFEQPTILDDDLRSLMVVRQSSTAPADTYLVSPGSKTEKKLTENVDYVPDLTRAHRETIVVTRQDGFKFEVKVTLPKYFTYGVKPPAFFWFYPSEFVDQTAYDRSKRTFNKNLFTQYGGANKAILTRLGYTLVEPDCPIIGPADRKNDEYVPQLRNNLAAVIDELDRRGWIDRRRLGIGGHSYGAFSTANALVNTPFFKAGIAGDGNFNRTLTPFGFQTDDRQLWDGRAFYLEMSPILFAERMTGALLMYHGMEDQNVGTDPINSERMFDSLEALGKKAALYKYPYEDHGQVAKETILDQWARFVAWLDKYVMNAK